jgi:hypothetical protein
MPRRLGVSLRALALGSASGLQTPRSSLGTYPELGFPPPGNWKVFPSGGRCADDPDPYDDPRSLSYQAVYSDWSIPALALK